MNKAITDGLVLMPPPFAAGLSLWSRGNGTPGSPSWAGQPNAALVPADQDFGGCLELQKVDPVQSVRSYAQIPFQPGMYLRVTVRLKAVAGALPSARIALWAGNSSGQNVAVPQTFGERALTTYGEVVTLTAILGVGNRQGVDLVWGTQPAYFHVGLDLTGASGGVVRIDDVVVEDVTGVFLRKLLDWVDVRDYGAVGDGVTNDAPAFLAADAAAQGRSVLVSAGLYFLNGNVTMNNPVRFEGQVTMPEAFRLALSRNYDLDTYAAAFGTELEGFRRAMRLLFQFADHVTFDMKGRRVDVPEPIDMAQVAGVNQLAVRRVLRNGQLNAIPGGAWTTDVVTSVASYATGNARTLTGVANVATVPVGALVEGPGVGREVYVTSKNVSAGTVTLSQPLYGGSGTRTYTFRRFKYLLDFGGFAQLSRFEIENMELQCNGLCSAILLPQTGLAFRLAESTLNRPKDRGITSTGTGCQGMFVDHCQLLSDEQDIPVQSRVSIGLNVNNNDVKIRNNRVVRFAHFAIINGTGHLILGNHFFQGDNEPGGVRRAGLILTNTNCSTVVAGNYVDNCHIEWGNEHDATPEFFNEFSFGGLNVTGNVFIASGVASFFRWIVIRPYGAGHFLNGLSITNNSFRVVGATIDRVEAVDTTFAVLDHSKARNVRVMGNSFNQVAQPIQNPIVTDHVQNTAASSWTLDASGYIPFGGRVRMVESVVVEGTLTNGANQPRFINPHAFHSQGPFGNQAILNWGEAVRGKVIATLRSDVPV